MAKRKASGLAGGVEDFAILGVLGVGVYLLWKNFGSPSVTGMLDSAESMISPTAGNSNADMGGEDFGTTGGF